MANSDFLIRAKADTKNYDANLAKAKKQLDSFVQSNMSAGGIMKQMSSSLVSTAAKFATFGAAVGGAMKLAKDAFFNSEQSLDEWGRTVAASESLYKGFLNALNTGDISGYLSNISQITKAAREAYDALDELGTYTKFNKRNMAEARSNYSNAVADFREGTGSKEAVQAASDALIKEMETAQKKYENAYEKQVAKIAAQRGVSAQDLMTVLTGEYGTFDELSKLQYSGKKKVFTPGGAFGGSTSYDVAYPVGERERLAQAIKNLNEDELEMMQGISEQAFMIEDQINNQRKATARILNGRGTSGSGSGSGRSTSSSTVKTDTSNVPIEKLLSEGANEVKSKAFDFSEAAVGATQSMKELQDELRKYKDALNNAKTQEEYLAASAGITRTESKIAGQPFALENGLTIPEGEVIAKGEELKEKLETYFKENPIDIYFDTSKTEGAKKLKKEGDLTEQAWSGVAKALESAGGALSAFQDPAINIAGTIAKSLANVAFAFAQSLKGTATPWDFIAGVAGGVAAMTAAVAAIKSVGKDTGNYAEGGIVHGNSYSGDNLIAHVNDGELILNRAAQGNIASQLAGVGASGGRGEVTVTADTMKLVLRNGAQKRGKTISDYLEL
jgi:hypothetical protein